MRRQLSAPEVLVWGGGDFPRNFALVAQIRGHFSIEELQNALTKVRQKDPQIAGRIVVTDGKVYYDSENVQDPPIREARGEWAEQVRIEVTTPFLTSAGPLVRFVVVQDNGLTYLIMVCHHCIADGLSAAYVLRDLLHFMGHPESAVDPLPPLPPFQKLLPPLETSAIPLPGMIQSMLSGRSGQPGQPGAQASATPRLATAPDAVYVMPWSLTRDQTLRLVSCSREEQTSVHAALCVAFMRAFARLEEGEKARPRVISSPISIRDLLHPPVGEHFGLFIYPSIKVSMDGPLAQDFWKSARGVRDTYRRETNSGGFWTLFHMIQMMVEAMPLEQALQFRGTPTDYDLSITNLGHLDFPTEYGALRLEAIHGPAVNAMEDEIILGVSTVADQLTFILVARQRLLDMDSAQRLMSLAMQEIATATGVPA